jgi:GTPase Era involved in 16S rRNA processing
MRAGVDSEQAIVRERQAAPASSGTAVKRPAPARIVVIGEFNSGKTSLVNALLGSPVLSASFVTRTAHPTAVTFAARPVFSAEIGNRRRVRLARDRLDNEPPEDTRWLHVGLPLERLRSLRVVDTPGLGCGEEDSDKRTLGICRQTDTVVWCTPAMQAWKASELHVWLTLPRSVRRRGILAVTFMDTLTVPTDAGRVLARLRTDAGDLFSRIVTTATQGVDEMLAAQAAGQMLAAQTDVVGG